MAALMLTVEAYRDKVLGGWQGKSAGVTLGAAHRGQLVPGRSNYFNPVPGQPVASIALDFPIVWLAMLEECGPEIAPEDLAVAWLEHLDYPEDEWGYAALNLRRGLPPPASGAYSNWFRHATGGVMRADFWALLAPGAPQVAAAYAYHDAKLDHSEEGIWAAMLLAAMVSASFFLTDPLVLITIGLAMIPKTCRTARGVKAALAAAQRGAAWLEARESVQHEVGSKNFTDAPQNMGFFTIGLLYGMGNFGNSLCAGVNCGYDAEMVGGALGALFGVRLGKTDIPEDWIRPIGDLVIPGVGVRDFDAPMTLTEVAERTLKVGRQVVADRCPDVEIAEPSQAAMSFLAQELAAPTPYTPAPPQSVSPFPAAPPVTSLPQAPASEFIPVLPETAPAVSLQPAESALPASDASVPPLDPDTSRGVLTPQPVSAAPAEPTPVSAPEEPMTATLPTRPVTPDLTSAIAWADNSQVKPLLVTPTNALVGQAGVMDVIMDTGDSPAIASNQIKTLSFFVTNRGAKAFSGRITLLAPSGWQISTAANIGQRQYIAAQTGTFRVEFTVRAVEGQARVDIANAVTLRFAPDDNSPAFDAEFLLLGASCWWTVGPFANFDGEGFDRSYMPEDRPGLNETYNSRLNQPVRWEKHIFNESVLDLEPLFKGSSGVCYGQTILRSPTTREARLVANTNSGVKLWFGGALVLRRFNREVFRPVLGSGSWATDITLRAGDNPVIVKWVRGSEPFQFSLTVSDRYGRGLPEVGNTAW